MAGVELCSYVANPNPLLRLHLHGLSSLLLQCLQVAHNQLWQHWVYSLHRLCWVTLEHRVCGKHPEHWQRGKRAQHRVRHHTDQLTLLHTGSSV